MTAYRRRSTILASLLFLAAPAFADWPHLRGPAFDGKAPDSGTFSADAFGLAVAWKAPMGAGYSGVAVAEGRAVTLFSDGKSDFVAAFDAANGKQAWRVRIADAYEGHDGSDGGPIASPAIAAGTVYALGPHGQLLALRLKDGSQVWAKSLEQDFGAKEPVYGYGSSPLVDNGLLILQAGGKDGRGLVVLDAKSGQLRWKYGDAQPGYQSPAAMTLAGRRQIVVVSPKKMAGLAEEDGKVLWQTELGQDDWFPAGLPTAVDQDRFLVGQGDGVAVYGVTRGADGLELKLAYRSTALGNGYAQPVYYDGHVYGIRGAVLTCMRASDGERVWRSRDPGGDGLILVDGHLVIFGAKGNVVVARATPAGYQERARTKALGGSALTWPAFSDGRVYVRNLDELAAVVVRAGAATAAAKPAEEGDHAFGRWLKSAEAAQNRSAMVDEYLAQHPESPIVEGEWVHFVWRGEAKDVALGGSLIDNETADPLRQLAGTDLFYRSYRLEPGARWEYHFQIDYDKWVTDPRNPRTAPGLEEADPLSEFVSAGYAPAKHLEEPAGPKGRLDTFTLKSTALGVDKEVKVWLPPSYDAAADSKFPLLVVQDGQSWLDKGLLVRTLDNVVGKNVAPVVVAFVPADRRFWIETGGSRTDDYAKMLGEELVPALEQRYRLTAAPDSRAVWGTGFYGFSSAYAALKYPAVFGKAGVQSAYLGLGSEDSMRALIQQGAGKAVGFYVDWNRYDERSVDRGWDFAEESKRLTGLLRDAGCTVQGGEVLDSYGWGGWRNRSDRMLVALFPSS